MFQDSDGNIEDYGLEKYKSEFSSFQKSNYKKGTTKIK